MKGISDELELTNQALQKYGLATITLAEYLELLKVSELEREQQVPRMLRPQTQKSKE